MTGFERALHWERDTESNADDCRSFIIIHADVLIPLSKSKDVTLEEKQVAIKKYLQSLVPFQKSAMEIEDKLSKLQEDIEAFPPKVSEAVNAKKQSNVITKFLTSIWSMATGLINFILQLLKKIDFSCFGARFRFEGQPYEKSKNMSESEPLLPEERLEDDIADDCLRINGALDGLRSAWKMVELSCKHLINTLGLSEDSESRTVCNLYLDKAEETSAQLLQYSVVLSASCKQWE